MRKSEIMLRLKANKLALVVRGASKKEAVACSLAGIDGGIETIEVAYTNPFASQVIAGLREAVGNDPEILIGAGTVLDDVTARLAILAGAQFIVSPSFSRQTSRLCHRYAIPYIPGCMTIEEVVTALESGAEMVKVFPGATVGMSFIKAIKSPLPQVDVMVTGGVTVTNVSDWFAAGAQVLGVGGEFNQLAAQGQFQAITARAADYMSSC